MQTALRTLVFVAASLLATSLHAQSDTDATGHWEGSVEAPGTSITFAIDLARDDTGELAGTISIPQQNVKGLPLAKVAVSGAAVNLSVRADQGFSGVLSSDGQSISGSFSAAGGSAPFTMKRTGDARIEPRPTSRAISKRLEGTWNGAVQGPDKQLRLVITMANHPDGTARGSIVNVDEGALEIPVVIAEEGPTVTIKATAVEAAFSGVLNAEGTELAGTLRTDKLETPVTFRRASP
jgi:hypothetical protein